MLSSVEVCNISDNDLFYKKVKISNTEQLTLYRYILLYYSADTAYTKSLDLEINYYIYVNCKFSNWTIYELYYFVNKFSSFYVNKFPNNPTEKM